MKNKTFKILEIGTFQTFSFKFISETVKDRGNPSAYYRKPSTQFIQQQQKSHQNLMKNKNYICKCTCQICEISEFGTLLAPLFRSSGARNFSSPDVKKAAGPTVPLHTPDDPTLDNI